MQLKPPSEFVQPRLDIQDGDIITILDEGEYRSLPQDPSREVLTFKVKTPSGDTKKLSMNATSQARLMKLWGMDSKKWVGKKVRVEIVKQQVFDKTKDVMYLFPPEQTMEEPEAEEIPDDYPNEDEDIEKEDIEEDDGPPPGAEL